MKITLKLSESLLSIYHAEGRALEENIIINSEHPLTIARILDKAGINHLLTPMVLIDEKLCKPAQLVKDDCVITLIGPLAGG